MTKLSINQNEDNGFDIIFPSKSVTFEEVDGIKTIVFFDKNNNQVSIQMSNFEFNILAEKFSTYCKSDDLALSTLEKEDAYRNQLKYFMLYSDRSIQLTLREIQSDSLVDFMWYMKDAKIIQKILVNMSERASEMILEDLKLKWTSINPDNCPVAYAKQGRSAVEEVYKIIKQLTDEGQIENFEENDA